MKHLYIFCFILTLLFVLSEIFLHKGNTSVGDIVKQENLSPANKRQMQEFQNISNWAQLALEELGYISHLSIREDLAKSRVFFTDTGWQKYLTAMENAGLAEYLKQNSATQVIKLNDKPNIKDRKDNGSVYQWYITIPSERLISLSNGAVNRQVFDILLIIHANKKQNDGYVPYRIEQIIFMG